MQIDTKRRFSRQTINRYVLARKTEARSTIFISETNEPPVNRQMIGKRASEIFVSLANLEPNSYCKTQSGVKKKKYYVLIK